MSTALAPAPMTPEIRYGKAWYVKPDPQNGRPRGMWAIEAKPDVVIRLKRIFPRIEQARSRVLTVVDTPDFARDLLWVMDRWPMEMDARSRARLSERVEEHRERELNLQRILNGEGLASDRLVREPALPARWYQSQAADLCLSTGRLLCADDLGAGKTFTGLLLSRDRDSLPMLVVTLTNLTHQWEEEVQKFFPQLRTHVVRKATPYNPTKHRSMRGKPPHVLIMNYAKLRGWGDFLAGVIKSVVFDEIQELRRDDSAKYIAAAMIADEANFSMGLTATPVYNYGGEMFNIIRVLDEDALGSKEEFVREWGQGADDKIKVRDPKAFGAFLRDEGLMLRRTRAELGIDLPEITRIPHTVDTDEATLDRLTGDAYQFAELLLSSETAPIDKMEAGREVDWRLRHATGVSKAPYVADFVRLILESGEKVVLYGWHHDVYRIWMKRLEDFHPVKYTGEESDVQKRLAKARFLSEEEPGTEIDLSHIVRKRRGAASNLLIMSLRSGAGLEGLQDACNVAVFGELDWSPGIHEQAIGRIHRPGQVNPCVAYFLTSNGGTDPMMAEVLDTKRMQSDPMRDPERGIVENTIDTSDRVKKLAMLVMAKGGAR